MTAKLSTLLMILGYCVLYDFFAFSPVFRSFVLYFSNQNPTVEVFSHLPSKEFVTVNNKMTNHISPLLCRNATVII